MERLPRNILVALVVLAVAGTFVFQIATAHLASPLEPLQSASGEQPVEPSTARSWAAPILATPYAEGWQPRVALPRVVLALGGREALDAAAALLVVAFVVSLVLAMRSLGSRWLPAAAASLTLVAAGVLRNPPALACGFAWQAMLAAAVVLMAARCIGPLPPTRVVLVALVIVLALAVNGEPSWLVIALPVLLCLVLAGRTASRRATSAAGHPMGSARARQAAALPFAGRAVGAALLGCAVLAIATLHALVATSMTFGAMPVGPGENRLAVGVADIIRAAFLGAHSASGGTSALAGTTLRATLGAWLTAWRLLGSVLAVAGCVRLIAARRHAAITLALGCLLTGFLLAAIRTPADAAPAMLLVLIGGAILVALGGTWVMNMAAGWEHARSRVPLFAASVLVVLPPILHLAAVPPLPRPFDGAAGAAYADAIARATAPARRVFVSDTVALDRLALGLVRPGFGGTREAPTRIPRDPAVVAKFLAAGYVVYALPLGRDDLAAKGISFTDRPLTYANLGRYLDTVPPGTVAAIAASAGGGEAARHWPLPFADRLGGARHGRASAMRTVCLAGRVGARSGAIEMSAAGSAELRLRAGDEIGKTGLRLRSDMVLHASDTEAVVDLARRGRVRAESGIAIGIINPDGDLVGRAVVDASTGFQLAIPRTVLTLAQAGGVSPCVDLRGGQSRDVTPLAAGGAIGWSRNEEFEPVRSEASALTLAEASGSTRRVPLDEGRRWGMVRLGRATALTATNGSTAGLRLCAAQAQDRWLFERPGQRVVELDIANPDDPTFGGGWFAPEYDGGNPFRWISGTAAFFLNLAAAANVRLVVTASPTTADPPPTLSVSVNGQLLDAREMAPGTRAYDWTVPEKTWRNGLNEVKLLVSRTLQGATERRPLAASIGSVRLERVE